MTKRQDAILEDNLALLQKHRPDLVPIAMDDGACHAYRVVMTASGIPNVIKLVHESGTPVPYYDADNPSKSVAEDLAAANLDGARLVLLLGMGLGYELLHFLSFVAPKAHTWRLIAVEADPHLFRLALRTTRLRGVLNNQAIELLVGLDHVALYARLYDLFKSGATAVLLKTLAAVHTRGSMAFNRDYYVTSIKVARQAAVEAIENFGNAPHDSLIGIRNMLLNVPRILRDPGIQELEGAFSGRPAIIASTGPSLNKNAHLLRELQEKAVILAPDASLAPLQRYGVRPHILTSLERVPQVAHLFRGFDASDVYLAACPVIDPRAYAVYSGPTIVVYRPFDHFKWLGVEKGTLLTGPSAANMAFKLAEFLGCNPIILVGQDLSFGDDGRSHASGAALGERQIAPAASAVLEVPGNIEGRVRTTRTWLRFLKYFEYDIANYKGVCINATEGGAHIAGTQVMSLRQAASQYLRDSIPVRDVIKQRLKPPTESDVEDGVRRVLEVMRTTFEAMIPVIRRCREGFLLAHDLSSSWTADELADAASTLETVMGTEPLRRLEKIRCEAVTVERDAFQLFIAHTVQPFLLSWQMDFYDMQRHVETGRALALKLVKAYGEWFRVVGSLVLASLQALKLGERSLRAAFPHVASDCRPLPDRVAI